MQNSTSLTPVVLDFETYYAKGYSLRSMPTSSYIRDDQFHVHGVGVAVGDNNPVWLTGQDVDDLFAAMPWQNVALIGHNLNFDGLILTERYGVRPGQWVDTLGMARAIIGGRLKSLGLDSLGEAFGIGGKLHKGKALHDLMGVRHPTPEQMAALGQYCIDDVNKTRALYKILSQGFPANERDILSWTIEMSVEPTIGIDKQPLLELAAEEKAHKRELVKRTGLRQTQISSNQQFAAQLQAAGVTPPTKVSPTTGRETFAFSKQDEAFTDLLEHPDEKVVDLVEARLAVKSTIKESRATTMQTMADQGPWALQLNYSGAMQTHRLSGGGGVNPQNLPRNMPDKPSLLRKALRAKDGRKLVAIDLSQIELRVNCAVSGQVDVLDRLAQEGWDEYSYFAGLVYGREITKADKIERNVGKVGVLSLGYGSGAATFRTMLRGWGIRMPLAECQQIVNTYRRTYPFIKGSWGVYDGWLRSWLHGETPVMPDPISAPITLSDSGFYLPSGLAVSYPGLTRYDWENRRPVSADSQSYTDNIQDPMNPFPNPKDCGFAYTNMRQSSGVATIYGSKVCGNVCQSLARDVNFYYVAELRRLLPHVDPTARIVMSVHDESVIECAEDKADAVLAAGLDVMNTPPVWWPDLLVAAEGSVGQNYAEAK